MTRKIKWMLFAFLLSALFGTEAKASTYTATSCNTSDVQSAINSAAEGDTVAIPSCPSGVSWTSGVTISGKGITVVGAGSGRIIAYDNGTEMLTVGTGTKTITIAGYSPGFSAASITNGETLRVFENNARTNYMQGTVTSLSAGVLTLNITSTGGSGTTHRWLIATIPSTVLINNFATANSALFNVTEDTAFHTNLSGFKIAYGTGAANGVNFNYTSGGQAILLHDCWIEQVTQPSGASVFLASTNRGVIWNCSFDSTPYSMAPLAIFTRGSSGSWTSASTWGAADTTGQNNVYVETNDFHAYINALNPEDNSRLVVRYNLMDNAGMDLHGSDTAGIGVRFLEFYNNIGVFNGYGDGTTFNMQWWLFWRGGTGVVHHNTLPNIASQDYTSPTIKFIVENLQRNAGPDPCWGANYSTPGQYYHVPRQPGFGYVTGTGTANYPAGGFNNVSTDYNAGTGFGGYVGDSEPVYIWANSSQPLNNVVTGDYGAGGGCSGTTDSTANYVVLNRDYFNGSTAKPGYTPYTYPHPFTLGSGTSAAPTPPSSLAAVVH
jgi:hypothetical protein